MTEVTLPYSSSGLFSVFTNHSMTVQQNKKQLIWHLEWWRQLPQNFSGSLTEKNWMRQWDVRIHLYQNSLKPSVNLADILGKYSSQMLFAILPKRWWGGGGGYLIIIELLSNITEHYFLFSILAFFFLFINNLTKVVEGQ